MYNLFSKLPFCLKNNFYLNVFYFQILLLIITSSYLNIINMFSVFFVFLNLSFYFFTIKNKIMLTYVGNKIFIVLTPFISIGFINKLFLDFDFIHLIMLITPLCTFLFVLCVSIDFLVPHFTENINTKYVKDIEQLTNKKLDFYIIKKKKLDINYKIDNYTFCNYGLIKNNHIISYNEIFNYLNQFNIRLDQLKEEDFEIINLMNN